MMKSQDKIFFPTLPFDIDLPYIEIAPLNLHEMNEKSDISNFKKENQMENNNLSNKNLYVFRKKKCQVKMDEKASIFKFSFYQLFTTRKKFPKKFVIMIHNEICANLNLRCINRDESRSIDLYFTNFARHSEKIILFLKAHKNNIIQKIPELKEIMNLYIE